MNRTRLKSFFPHFEGEPEKTHQALLLHLASLVLFFVSIAFILLNTIFGNLAEKSANTALAGIALLQIPVQLLMRSGRVRDASRLLLFVCWIR